jgi:hypothetical protein
MLVVFLRLAVFGSGAWVGRAPLLQGPADPWIVPDVPHAADAAAIFGGGLSVRPAAAAAHYRGGLVKIVLISNVRSDSTEALGLVPSHTLLNHNAVLKFGAPATALDLFGVDLSNSHQEAIAVRNWALSAHAVI